MRILINVELSSKIEKYGFKTVEELRLSFGKIAETLCNYTNTAPETIRDISFCDTQNYGEVMQAGYEPLCFNIVFAEKLLPMLYNSDFDDTMKAESIIFHEFCHCKDTSVIAERTELRKLEKDSYNLDELYANLGYHQWQEYYAHYNSSLIHPSEYREPKQINMFLEDYMFAFNQERLFEDPDRQIPIYNGVIHPYIRNAVILAANNARLHSKDVQDCIDKFANIDKNIGGYFATIQTILEERRKTYPEWVSYEAFKEIGKALLDIRAETEGNHNME